MKKWLAIVIALTSLFSLVACSGDAETTSEEVETTVAEMTEEMTEEDTDFEEMTENWRTDAPEIDATMSKDPEFVDVSEVEKRFTAYRDEYKITGVAYFPEGKGPFPTVIMSGIETVMMEEYAKAFFNEGIACILFNYASYKESTVLTGVADLYVVMEVAKTMHKVDTNNLFLWGHTYGGLISTFAATQKPEEIKGMVLLEPAYRENSQVDEVYNEIAVENANLPQVYVDDLKSFDIFGLIPNYTGPVIIFRGTADTGWVAEREKGLEQIKKGAKYFPSVEEVEIEGADMLFSGDARGPLLEKSAEFVKINME